MFRRKDEEAADAAEGTTQPANATTQAPQQPGSGEASAPAAAAPTAPASATAPVTASRPVAEAPRPAATAASFRPTPPSARMAEPRGPITASTPNPQPSDKAGKGSNRRILTVGNDILLKGEIATCDRLVIEGKVDATLNDVHTVEIAETGSFKGSAQIEDAEISGLFEGELVVKNRLVIYSTGKVRGKITYGEIEIERGGELTGEISMGNASADKKNKAA